VIQGDDHDQENSETSQTGQGRETGRTGKKEQPGEASGQSLHSVRRRRICQAKAARFSAFSAEDTALLAKAAASLHVRLVEVTNPDLTEVATKLPAGRLHASGGGLVPYIKGPLYLDLIAANLSDADPPASPDPTAQEIPGSWDEIVPGPVVIAKETSECGWWDAVVIERTGDLVTVPVPGLPGLPEHGTAPVGHRPDQPGRQVKPPDVAASATT
jgi:hypothetical protein